MKPRHRRPPPSPRYQGIACGALSGNPRLRRQRRLVSIGIALGLLMLLLVGCAALIGPTHREAQVAIAVVAFLLGGCGWLLGTFAGGSRLLDIWRRRR